MVCCKELKLYKDKYIIALYTLDDKFFGVFDNVWELALRLGRDVDQVSSTLTRLFKGDLKTINFKHTKYAVYFIDMTEEE